MAITKVSKNMSIIASLSDLPNATDGLTPAQLKAKFDEGGESLKTYINDTLIPNLESIVNGNSGADNIGASPIGTSPSTVQGILEWLKTQIDNSALGQIPDGSITDAKLSDSEGNIKQTVSAHLADYTQFKGEVESEFQEVGTEIDNLKSSVSSGKTQVATAITDKGIEASGGDTFGELASKIGQISTGKKWASGHTISDGLGFINVNGLTFRPSIILVKRSDFSSSKNAWFSVFLSQTYDSFGNGIDARYGNSGSPVLANATINSNGFSIQSILNSAQHFWLAIE